MENQGIVKCLEERGVKATANRILVLRELMHATGPLSLGDLEITLAPMDRASIFRVLELFSKHEILHVIEDGSRSQKYEVCHGHHHHSVADQHVHFYCERCGEVTCFEEIPAPAVALPDSYEVRSLNYMLKGVCPKCRAKS